MRAHPPPCNTLFIIDPPLSPLSLMVKLASYLALDAVRAVGLRDASQVQPAPALTVPSITSNLIPFDCP